MNSLARMSLMPWALAACAGGSDRGLLQAGAGTGDGGTEATDWGSPEDLDGDGFPNDQEQSWGSDPEDPYSWPYDSGQWPDFSERALAAGAAAEDWALSQTFPDFQATDQFGQGLHLYQFYGMVVLLDFSAGWCGPCRHSAAGAQAFWEQWREQGLLVMHLLIENDDGLSEITQDFQQGWAEDYGITFPVLDADQQTEPHQAWTGLGEAGLSDGSIPFLVLIGQDARLVTTYTGTGAEEEIESDLELLGL